jgi:hypothetical protein
MQANANFQAIRLVVEAGRQADLEVRNLKRDLEVFRIDAALAEDREKDLKKKIFIRERDIEKLNKDLELERAAHVETHEAWSAKWNEALASVGTPEEEVTQELDVEAPEPLAGTTEQPEKDDMETN